MLLVLLSSLAAIRVSQVQKVRVGKAPTYATLSPDGRHLFVSNYASDEISVIDTAANRTQTDFYGGYEPLGIAVTPLGDKILVANPSNGLIKVIDSKTHKVLDDIKVGGVPRTISISPKGFLAFVTNYSTGKFGRVDFVDTATHRILGEVEVGIRPMEAVVSELGDQLFVICGGSNELYVIDVQTRVKSASVCPSAKPRTPLLSLRMEPPCTFQTAEATTSP
jgi:YVTN family beta-propeller protein